MRLECMQGINLNSVFSRRPNALAPVLGSDAYPDIRGMVRFFQLGIGVIVVTEVMGLPEPHDVCINPVFGCHIHSGGCCTGNREDSFADAMAHYNPCDCEHPYHAGDMPPIFGNCGYAYSVFLTNRFGVEEIIGRTVIIHLHPDDFHSQPSGESGTKIACGVIKRNL